MSMVLPVPALHLSPMPDLRDLRWKNDCLACTNGQDNRLSSSTTPPCSPIQACPAKLSWVMYTLYDLQDGPATKDLNLSKEHRWRHKQAIKHTAYCTVNATDHAKSLVPTCSIELGLFCSGFTERACREKASARLERMRKLQAHVHQHKRCRAERHPPKSSLGCPGCRLLTRNAHPYRVLGRVADTSTDVAERSGRLAGREEACFSLVLFAAGFDFVCQ